MEFNTVAISDGITMGTEGMKASLVSREIIADSIELVARGYMFDAVVALVGCDKTIPGAAMGLIRVDVPSLILYGGSIAPGRYKGKDITIQDVFEGVGANAAGRMTDAELLEIENVACPGAGACGGQYTANTMATVMEFVGLSPFGSSSVPATDPRKHEVSFECGRLIMDILRRGVKPSDVLTAKAFEYSIAIVAATGGSTNAVLHLLAMAREAGVPLEIDELRPHQLADATPGRPEARWEVRRSRYAQSWRDPRHCQVAHRGGLCGFFAEECERPNPRRRCRSCRRDARSRCHSASVQPN